MWPNDVGAAIQIDGVRLGERINPLNGQIAREVEGSGGIRGVVIQRQRIDFGEGRRCIRCHRAATGSQCEVVVVRIHCGFQIDIAATGLRVDDERVVARWQRGIKSHWRIDGHRCTRRGRNKLPCLTSDRVSADRERPGCADDNGIASGPISG